MYKSYTLNTKKYTYKKLKSYKYGKLNHINVKLSILAKLITRFNAIPIKIWQASFLRN